MTYFTFLDTPIGRFLAAGDDAGLRHLAFADDAIAANLQPGWVEDATRFADLARQLDEYFTGERQAFDLALAAQGTPFQHQVWEAVRAIPYGERTTYADLARQLGRPGAARAVGAANACNPLPIVVPCHRVIGANGALTGYRGGLDIKRALLRREQECLSLTAIG